MTENWTRQAIIFALREKGTSVAEIAQKAGLTRFTLYGALERPYPKVHGLIAQALGRPRQDIWPLFYTRQGSRRGLIRRASRAA